MMSGTVEVEVDDVDVEVVDAYRTVLRPPDERDRARLDGAEVVVLASGSAAEAWVAGARRAEGSAGARIVAIGPTTGSVAERLGFVVTVAASPADDDVIAAVISAAAAPG